MVVCQGDVFWARLSPPRGSEPAYKRPVAIVQRDSINRSNFRTVVVVPLTTGRSYPFRIATKVQGKTGTAAIDQIRTVDKRRLVKRIAVLPARTGNRILDALGEMFEA